MSNYFYGLHAVQALLQKHPDRIKELLVMQGRDDERVQVCVAIANTQKIPIKTVTRQDLTQRVQSEHHQGIAILSEVLPEYTENDLIQWVENKPENTHMRLLILDGVQDPHNLGACLRSADAAGFDAVIIPKNDSVGVTATVRKVACGAAEIVPVVSVTNLARTMEKLKTLGIWIWGAAGEAERTIYQTDLRGDCAIVLGAEGRGLRRLTRERCDGLMRIPLQGFVNSLNVSVACGICLFEVVRQANE